MLSGKEIKKQARSALRNHFWRNLGIGFVGFAVKFAALLLIATLQFVFVQTWGSGFLVSLPAAPFYIAYALALFFVLMPVNTGIGVYFERLARGIEGNTDDIFRGYRKLPKTMGIQGRIFLETVAVTLFWAVAAGCVYLLSGLLGGGTAVGYAVCVLCYLALMIQLWIKYAAVTYMMGRYPELTATDTVKKAIQMTKGKRIFILGLMLTFAGWFLLGICTAGILFLWAVPYANVTLKFYFKNRSEEMSA